MAFSRGTCRVCSKTASVTTGGMMSFHGGRGEPSCPGSYDLAAEIDWPSVYTEAGGWVMNGCNDFWRSETFRAWKASVEKAASV